jgi:hypothetical protein
LLVVLIPMLCQAQTPNPRGVSGSFTSIAAQENEHIISLRVRTTGNRDNPAEFIYAFTASDSCRIVFWHAGNDPRFKPNTDGQLVAGYDDYVVSYIPVAADSPVNIDIHATHMSIFRAGGAATITYSAVVEYE